MSSPTGTTTVPPLLLGAALVFWGRQIGSWPAGLAAATVIELARFSPRRLRLQPRDFERVADLCAVLIVGAAAAAVEEYPGRKPRKARPLKTTTMVLAVSGGAVYLERRPPAGISSAMP